MLRARWIKDGNLLRTREDRCTPINEVDIVAAPNVAQLVAKLDETPEDPVELDDAVDREIWQCLVSANVSAWRGVAPLIWACVAHVFRVRGHHYKNELEALYVKTWRGNYN